MADEPTPPTDDPAAAASAAAAPPARRRVKPISNRLFRWGQGAIGFSMFAWMILVVFAIVQVPRELASVMTLLGIGLFALAFLFWILSCLVAIFERAIEVEFDPTTGKTPHDIL